MRIGRVAAELGEGLAEVLWPTRCVGCDQPGELICSECRAALPWIEQRLACPSCGAPFGYLTCTECDGLWPTRAAIAALGFHGTPARMVTCLKDGHELRLAPVIAAALLTALEEASAWPARDGLPRFSPAATDGVCFVPATAAAYARRGFDHMELVSRELAGMSGLPLADVLVRLAAGRLVSLERLRDPLPYEETEANDHSFELRREAGMLFKDLKRSLPSHPARLVSALLLSFTSARSSPFSSFLPARKEGGLRSGTASGRKKTLLLGFSRTSLTFALFSSHHGSKNRQAPREIGQEDSGFLYFEGNRFSNRLQFS